LFLPELNIVEDGGALWGSQSWLQPPFRRLLRFAHSSTYFVDTALAAKAVSCSFFRASSTFGSSRPYVLLAGHRATHSLPSLHRRRPHRISRTGAFIIEIRLTP